MKQITDQFRNGKSVGLYLYVAHGRPIQILTVFIITVHAMWSCEQHICSLRSKYSGNQLFQACKFLTITNSGSRCSVKCLFPCIYKLCDGFLTAVNKAYKMFDDEEQLEYYMGVAEEAKELLDQKLEEKRKQAKKEVKTS